LPRGEANALRDQVHAALHEGAVDEWALNGSRTEEAQSGVGKAGAVTLLRRELGE
jgi:hypothetical protein